MLIYPGFHYDMDNPKNNSCLTVKRHPEESETAYLDIYGNLEDLYPNHDDSISAQFYKIIKSKPKWKYPGRISFEIYGFKKCIIRKIWKSINIFLINLFL